MESDSGLGIGLSFVFGCILLGLVAELYYILWWKKRINNREGTEEDCKSIATDIPYMFCWKKPNSVCKTSDHHHTEAINGHEQDLEQGHIGNKDLLLKALVVDEYSVESEVMRLHNLVGAGPPRFLFTIKEETKEDLESDDGRSKVENRSRKGSRTRSLSDTSFLSTSPLSSPPSYINHGFNPLFEPISESDLNLLRSSPPPTFKFLRDAEEKLMKRLVEEEAERRGRGELLIHQDSATKTFTKSNVAFTEEEKDGSFLSFIGRSRDKEMHQQLPIYKSAHSKVLPLASSPSTFTSLDNKLVQ